MSKPHGTGNDADIQFGRNLREQEAKLWADYMQLGTRAALTTWRLARMQIQCVQQRQEACR